MTSSIHTCTHPRPKTLRPGTATTKYTRTRYSIRVCTHPRPNTLRPGTVYKCAHIHDQIHSDQVQYTSVHTSTTKNTQTRYSIHVCTHPRPNTLGPGTVYVCAHIHDQIHSDQVQYYMHMYKLLQHLRTYVHDPIHVD